MACNNTGYFTNEFAEKWGIVDYDWSNIKYGADGWSQAVPQDCQHKLQIQASQTKAASKASGKTGNNVTKVFVYRNMVKALPWYASVRDKLVDPQYSGFFLKFKCNASSGGKYEGGCHVPTQGTPFYHDQEQTAHGRTCPLNMAGPSPCCGVPCGEYLFDHRNGSMLQQWFIDEFVSGPDGIDSPDIDGFYFDDGYYSTGATEEDPYNVEDCGLSREEVQAVSDGWAANAEAVGKHVLAKGGFAMPYFEGTGIHNTDPKANCAEDLRRLCSVNPVTGVPNVTKQALLHPFSRQDHTELWSVNGTLPYFEQDLATFLLVRGPYAWLGYEWSGCTDSGYPTGCDKHCLQDDCKPCRFPVSRDANPFPRPAAMDDDYGTPVGYCKEAAPGVFRREWTKADVELDCNTYAARFIAV